MRRCSQEGAGEHVEPEGDHGYTEQREPELVGKYRRTARSHRAPAETAPHGHTVGVEAAFLWVMIAAVGLGILLAIALFFVKGDGYESIGRGGFGLDGDEQPRGPQPGSAAFQAEADEEIRQMVEARNVRRAARGQAPLDVDDEIAALTRSAAPANADPALREEVRQLVAARNERRARQGKPPLDVESEVDRQLRELGA